MSKKILSLLLAFIMLLSLAACVTDTPPASSDGPAGESTPSGSPEPSTPTDTDPESPKETDPDEGVVYPESGVLSKGTLWFYEDFEDVELSDNSVKTALSLGWSYDMSSDAQFKQNTADYRIEDKNGSRQLYIRNQKASAEDSYITILSERQFKFLHKQNYSYQYDITYTGAVNGSKYIALLTSYNGSDKYNAAYICNGGFGANENNHGTSVTPFDESIAAKDDTSLASRLLGKGYTTGVFNNISISVRYAINWEKGNSVYVRINTEGYPESGKWVLVSQSDPDSAAIRSLTPTWGGSAIALKTGGKQNGYIDNIMIWSGNGDEPADKSSPFLNSRSACHKLIEYDGQKVCALCGKTEAQTAQGWKLSGIPKFDGGSYSDKTYLNGQGIEPDMPESFEGKMQIVNGTTPELFGAYLKKLEANGFKLDYSKDADGNLYRSYTKDNTHLYTYYTAATGETRVISERLSETGSDPVTFGYPYEPKTGESSAVYQYALPMRDAYHLYKDGYIDRGMLYVIKLADNSIILIDGGEDCQFTNAQLDNLMSFLREITGVGETGKVRIAAWYLTHAHGDHLQGFAMLLRRHHTSIELERIMYNIPSSYINIDVISNGGVQKLLRSYVYQYYPKVEFLKLHSGMTVQLADVKIDVLYTHEDLVDPHTGVSEIGGNYNESSLVSKFTFGGGKTFLCTGDIDAKASSVILQNWKAETLQVDVLQLAHHVLNDLSYFYDVIKAPILLIPQSLHRIKEHSVAPVPFASASKYAKDDMMFFQNEYTVGIGVADGELKKIYSKPIVYETFVNATW